MAVVKTITIDERTALIAGRIPNFSAWVRMKLLEHARSATIERPEVTHVAPPSARIWGETEDKCNPKHKKGLCGSCWGPQ